MKVKKAEWWESDQNDLDNDIEQFSKAPGGGGCCVRIASSILTSVGIVLFLFLL